MAAEGANVSGAISNSLGWDFFGGIDENGLVAFVLDCVVAFIWDVAIGARDGGALKKFALNDAATARAAAACFAASIRDGGCCVFEEMLAAAAAAATAGNFCCCCVDDDGEADDDDDDDDDSFVADTRCFVVGMDV